MYKTLDEVAAEAMEIAGISDSRDIPIIKHWIHRAVLDVGVFNTDIAHDLVPVIGFEIKKPCGFVSLIEIDVYDVNGGLLHTYFNRDGLSSEDAPRTSSICIAEGPTALLLSTDALDASKAEIKYYRIPTDEDGDIMILDGLVDAVISYIEYMYVRRNTGRSRQFNPNMINSYEAIWQRKKQQARSRNKMPSEKQFATIASRWRSMINNVSKSGYRG